MLIDLVAHKSPNLQFVEVNTLPDDSISAWLYESIPDTLFSAATAQYHYTSVDANALISAREKYKDKGNTEISLLDISKPTANLLSIEDTYGLIIVRLPTGVRRYANYCRQCWIFTVLIQPNAPPRQLYDKVDPLKTVLESNEFYKTRHVSKTEQSIALATAESRSSTVQAALSKQVNVVQLSNLTPVTQNFKDGLKRAGWTITEHAPPFASLEPKSIIRYWSRMTSLLPSCHQLVRSSGRVSEP